MKKETIKKRLDAKCVNKNSSAYRLLNEWLAKDGNTIIRPCWTSGRGRYCTNLDYTTQTVALLEILHVRYEVGNDAPRGGLTGNFIKIKL